MLLEKTRDIKRDTGAINMIDEEGSWLIPIGCDTAGDDDD